MTALRPLLAALLLLSLPAASPRPAAAQVDALAQLPRIAAAVVDSMPVPGPGLRGMARLSGRSWMVRGAPAGLGVARGGWSSGLLRADGAEVQEVASQRDAWTAGLAFDGEAFWTAGGPPGEGLLYRISVGGQVLRTLPLPGYHPVGLVYADEYLWLLDGSSRTIYRIEPEEGRVSRKLPAPAFYPCGLARGGGALWVADAATGHIYRLRPDNGRVEAVVEPAAHHRPGQAVALEYERGGLWVLPAEGRMAWRLELADR